LFDELASVSRLSDSAGRDGANAVISLVAGEGSQSSNDLQSSGHGGLGQPTGFERTVPQPGHILEPIEDLVRSVRLDFRQDHVNGVCSDVENAQFGHAVSLTQLKEGGQIIPWENGQQDESSLRIRSLVAVERSHHGG